MRKGKVMMVKIDEKLRRQVTFSKRKKSLLKKAYELSVLCDVHVGVMIFSESNKLYDFFSRQTSMENLIMRCQKEKGHTTTADHVTTIESLKREINNLKVNIQFYRGHGLNLLTYDDLVQLENELLFALQNARARKFDFMREQQMNTLQGKVSSWPSHSWQQMMIPCQREGDYDVMNHDSRQVMKKEFPSSDMVRLG